MQADLPLLACLSLTLFLQKQFQNKNLRMRSIVSAGKSDSSREKSPSFVKKQTIYKGGLGCYENVKVKRPIPYSDWTPEENKLF